MPCLPVSSTGSSFIRPHTRHTCHKDMHRPRRNLPQLLLQQTMMAVTTQFVIPPGVRSLVTATNTTIAPTMNPIMGVKHSELQRAKRWGFYAPRTAPRNKEDTCVLRIFNQDRISSCCIFFCFCGEQIHTSLMITMIGQKSTILEWVVGECWITNL